MKNFENYSVLMSVYYKENPLFLKKAIESIVNQSVKSNDFVIVCDGPLTEELYHILDTFCDDYPYINVYKLEKNQGLGKALAFGIEKCKNNLVGRMDSDDVSDINRFMHLLNEYNNTKAAVTGGYIEEFYDSIGDIKIIRDVPLTEKGIKNMIKKRNPMNHVSVLLEKNSVEEVGGYQDLPYLEDYYLWVRMLEANKKIVNIDKTLVYVRTGREMYKRRGNKKQIYGWLVLQKRMNKIGMVSNLEAIINMITIIIFVYCPSWIKKYIYKKILRVRGNV